MIIEESKKMIVTDTKTLKQRLVHSGGWVIFGHLFSQVLRLGSNLILTRLLVPEMFGVMAIVTVIMAGR